MGKPKDDKAAAGPWRTDVESAEPGKEYVVATKGLNHIVASGDVIAAIAHTDMIIAFAELNPFAPEAP
jgi:hypothetical protein